MEKREILSHRKIFRQIDSLVTFLVYSILHSETLLSRKKCETKFLLKLHTVQIVKQKLTGFPSTKMQRLPSLAM